MHQLVVKRFQHCLMHGVTMKFKEECNVVVKCEELIGTTEYLTLWTGYRLNRGRYNRVCLYTKVLCPVRNASNKLKN